MSPDPLWSVADAVAATGGTPRGEWSASGVSIDSRTLKPGDLFVAIDGPNFNGHDFAAAALEGGAAASVVTALPEGCPAEAPRLEVADTLAALTALGRAGRARSRARVAAITGSAGKTGSKDALGMILADQAVGHTSDKSLNNHWGVPLSLARMPAQADYGVFELGMNHGGEIAPLSDLVRPHVALITTVESAHRAHFASVEDIADAKAEIFSGVEADGAAVLNRDNPHFDRLAGAAAQAGIANIIGFGFDERAEARILDFVQHAECSCVSASIRGQEMTYKVNAPGRHWIMNSLGVLATAQALGADLGLAGLTLARVVAPQGRGNRIRVETRDGAFEVLDESYNANPASMRAAFETLRLATPGAGGRRIAVLGDMLELGPESAAFHAELHHPLIESGVDLVFTSGAEMSHLDDGLPAKLRADHCLESTQLAQLVRRAVRPGDVVMVKGSLGSRMGVVVEELRGLSEPLRGAAVNG